MPLFIFFLLVCLKKNISRDHCKVLPTLHSATSQESSSCHEVQPKCVPNVVGQFEAAKVLLRECEHVGLLLNVRNAVFARFHLIFISGLEAARLQCDCMCLLLHFKAQALPHYRQLTLCRSSAVDECPRPFGILSFQKKSFKASHEIVSSS